MFCRQIRTVKLQPRHRFLPHQQQRLVTNSNRSASSNGPRNIFAGSWKLPATLGFAFIGFLQWQHLNHPTDEERKTHPAVALLRLPGSRTAFEATMATERQLQALKLFPYRAASRLWGAVHNKDLYERWQYQLSQGRRFISNSDYAIVFLGISLLDRRGCERLCTRHGPPFSTAIWTR